LRVSYVNFKPTNAPNQPRRITSRLIASATSTPTSLQTQRLTISRTRLRFADGKHTRCVQPHVPMTLHNLDSHISWLLHSKPTVVSCVALVHRSTATAATLQKRPDASVGETNTTHLEIQRPRFDPQLEVDNSTRLRHTNPSSDINQAGPPRETVQKAEESNMARLASASRSSRPKLLHNQQTPVGAPGTTTPSSIAAAYAASFHKDGV
jgi:hypothetical protein